MKLTFLASFFLLVSAKAQSFFDLNSIQKIELTFPTANWDYMMDTAKYGHDEYVLATQLVVNGVSYDSVGVKFKGNSSYDSTYVKNPLHIELDAFKNQDMNGITDIKLGNGYDDPSVIREVLSYNILKNYMDCPRSNFAQVYINGVYKGVYSNAENISKKFCASKLYTNSSRTFIKCNPIVNPGVATKCSLRFLAGVDSTGYYNFYEVKSDYGYNELKNVCDVVSNTPNKIDSVIDIDKFTWMTAFNNLLVNLDSYSGAFSQNYYLYKDNAGRLSPFVWDLNMSFGGFPFAGSGAFSLGTLNVQGMQQMPHTLHSTDVNWPVLKDILSNTSLKKKYVAHMRTMMNEVFASNQYLNMANQYRTLIDTAVASDLTSFFDYTHFQHALDSNYVVSGRTVPGISSLMAARLSYLQALPDFTAVPPSITTPLVSNANPNVFTTVYVTASVSNASNVYLNYRYSLGDAFITTAMFDDGQHQDGAANDQVYGAAVNLQSSNTQYYVYAENANAGMFSPQRAEYEFYSITATQTALQQGSVVFNEIVSNNQSGALNESGVHEDWIELFNNTDSVVMLNGLYLTDSVSIPTKFAFPVGTSIPAHGIYTIWADDKSSTNQFTHCNFKLDALGETLMLSNGFGLVLDSVSYGLQQADTSLARCPDGTGILTNAVPTFHGLNCTSGINEVALLKLEVYPNPASDELNVFTNETGMVSFHIFNSMGELVYSDKHMQAGRINLSAYPEGIYSIQVGTATRLFVVRR